MACQPQPCSVCSPTPTLNHPNPLAPNHRRHLPLGLWPSTTAPFQQHPSFSVEKRFTHEACWSVHRSNTVNKIDRYYWYGYIFEFLVCLQTIHIITVITFRSLRVQPKWKGFSALWWLNLTKGKGFANLVLGPFHWHDHKNRSNGSWYHSQGDTKTACV